MVPRTLEALVRLVRHGDRRALSSTGLQLVDGAGGGLGGCSGREYRTGFNASKRCECVATPALTSARGWCAMCRGPLLEELEEQKQQLLEESMPRFKAIKWQSQ